MVKRWHDLEGFSFESEALDFLPHAPVLLTMGSEGRIAELRRAREGRLDDDEDVEVFSQGRRSGTS